MLQHKNHAPISLVFVSTDFRVGSTLSNTFAFFAHHITQGHGSELS